MAEDRKHLTIQDRDGITVVEFSARKILEELTIREIETELVELVSERRGIKLILNFTNVGHFSSAALGTLNKLFELARQSGGRMILTGISPRIMEVFEITNLHKRFEIRSTVAEALAEF
jgi:anti-anti-sigma factor